MKSLSCLLLSAVRHSVAWTICLTMLSPALTNAEDQSEQKHKKNNETTKKNNDENRSNSTKNQSSQSETQSKQNNDTQSRSGAKPDNFSSTNHDQRPSGASPGREHGNPRSPGDINRGDSNISKPPVQQPSAAGPGREHGNPRSTGDIINRGDGNISKPPIQRPSAAGLEGGYIDFRSIERTNQPPQGSNPRWVGNIIRDVRDAFPRSDPFPPHPINPHPPNDRPDDDDNDNDDDNNYCYNCSGYYQGLGYGNYEPYYEIYRPRIKIVKTNVEEIVTPTPTPTRTVSGVARRTVLSPKTRTYSFDIRSFLERQVERVRELLVGRWPGAKQLSQVAIETVEYCDNRSGVVTLTYYDEDNSGRLSVNDRFIFRFENCQDNKVGVTADGRMELRVTELAGDAVNEIAPYTFGGRFNFNRLDVVNNQTNRQALVKGNMDFNLSARQKLSRQNAIPDR